MEFAASIIAVIQLTGKVTSLGYRYISGVTRATKDLLGLVKELGSLVEVLDCLQEYANTNPQSAVLQKLNSQTGPLRGCAVELQRLQLKLEPKDGMKGVFQNLKWPLQESETSQHIMGIERHKNLFALALTLDQTVLLKEIEKYARETNVAVEHLQNQSIALSGEIEAYARSTDLAVQNLRNDFLTESTAQGLWRQKEDLLRVAEKRDKVLNWLYPETIQQKHIEIQNRRRGNTGSWILGTPELKEWIKGERDSQLLWGYGIAGAGKTFLSSVVIDHLQEQALAANYGVAHFYFDYKERDRQRPIDVLASLVKQLARRIPYIPTDIEALHDKHELDPEERAPTFEELYASFLTVSKSFTHVFFILDALDECDKNNQRRELLPLFHRMGRDGASLFLTSRQYPEDIQESFRGISRMELSAKQEDIRIYIQGKINENSRAKRLVQQAKCEDRIISELVDCSQGMFLIVRFHVEYLCCQPTAKQMLMELAKLQRSATTERPLDPTYDRAMKILYNQPKSCANLAIKILSWLVKAQRTLTVEELRKAVSVEPGRYELDELDLPDRATLLDVCASLVTIDEHSHTIGLAHYTVQEYLLRKSIIPGDANFRLAMACTTFLSFNIFSQGACTGEPGDCFEDRLRSHPFLKYAADHLSYHLHSCDEDLTTNTFLRFLGSQGNISSYLQAFHFKAGNGKPYPRNQLPLHIASAVGHKAAAQVLLDNGANPSIADKYGRTASYLAISRGHEAVVRLFLDRGADATIPVADGRTALHKAASKGFEGVIRLLLEKGVVDVSVRENRGRTPLHLAASRGHIDVVQLLLENRADLSTTANNGSTPLHTAAYQGHEAVVQLLIGNGAKLSVPDNDGITALYMAASQGHEAVVRLLLDKGADFSALGNNGLTALAVAAREGHQAVVRLLLERGGDLSICKGYIRAPLHLAASRGRQAVMQLLLEKGSNLSTMKSQGRTALHEAAFGGHEKAVKLLLENGTELSEVDYSGSTALHLAACQGHEAVVRLLLGNGSNILTRCGHGRTALHFAASGGHQKIVSLLLEGGADLSVSDQNGRTALHDAASQGHVVVVQLLLEKGADVSISDKNGWTALQFAVLRRHQMVIQILRAKLSIADDSVRSTGPGRIFRPLLVGPVFTKRYGLGYSANGYKRRRVVR